MPGGRGAVHVTLPTFEDVLSFWFAASEVQRPEWFRKDAAFDGQIRARFGELHAHAAAGGLTEWEREPRPALALLVVLDQFSRNLYRNDPRAFAQDARALAVAESMLARGWDRELWPLARQFVYLPLEHAEDLARQDRAVGLFEVLQTEPGLEGLAKWAEKHREVIRRFGRFPHRNAALGRASTPEEADFLLTPGSGF
ncbi:hypothetical protein BWI17_12145 [Betaproteobacteria bacterium GR16-43]|nr:hypothetical protein BWI17_12145 [Betaproteobacteria bacterium GR16-43]